MFGMAVLMVIVGSVRSLFAAPVDMAPWEGDWATDCGRRYQCSLEIRRHWMGLTSLYRIGYVVETNDPAAKQVCSAAGWVDEVRPGVFVGQLFNHEPVDLRGSAGGPVWSLHIVPGSAPCGLKGEFQRFGDE